MIMKRAAPVRIKHMLDPRPLPMLLRIQQILRKRRRDLPAPHNQLPHIGRQSPIRARLERLHRRDDGERSLHKVRARIVEDEAQVAALHARLRGAVISADAVCGEVAEVFDEDFFCEGEEAEGGEEVVVGGWFADVRVAAVEPVYEELEGGGVVVGEVELFGFGFGEFAEEGGAEVVGAVAEEGFVDAECFALWTDEDVYRADG